MTGPNPMIPAEHWGGDAQQGVGILCARCVRAGDYTPPARVVIIGGESLCLNHAVAPVALPE